MLYLQLLDLMSMCPRVHMSTCPHVHVAGGRRDATPTATRPRPPLPSRRARWRVRIHVHKDRAPARIGDRIRVTRRPPVVPRSARDRPEIGPRSFRDSPEIVISGGAGARCSGATGAGLSFATTATRVRIAVSQATFHAKLLSTPSYFPRQATSHANLLSTPSYFPRQATFHTKLLSAPSYFPRQATFHAKLLPMPSYFPRQLTIHANLLFPRGATSLSKLLIRSYSPTNCAQAASARRAWLSATTRQ